MKKVSIFDRVMKVLEDEEAVRKVAEFIIWVSDPVEFAQTLLTERESISYDRRKEETA